MYTNSTFKELVYYAWLKALNISYIQKHDYIMTCYICGRICDNLFNFVELLPHIDRSLDDKLVYVCKDHGRVMDYNCLTGELLELPLPVSYNYRLVRNYLQWLVLHICYSVRFVYYLSYSYMMWNVVWKCYYLKRRFMDARNAMALVHKLRILIDSWKDYADKPETNPIEADTLNDCADEIAELLGKLLGKL